MYFSNFIIISTWKRIGPSFEITRIPFSQGYFVPSLAEIVQGVWRRRFFNFVNVFSPFCNYLPLEKGGGPSFEQTWIPFNKGWFVPTLVEIGPVVLEKKMKMWKVYDENYDNNENDDDDGQILIRKAHISLRLRWATILNCNAYTYIFLIGI